MGRSDDRVTSLIESINYHTPLMSPGDEDVQAMVTALFTLNAGLERARRQRKGASTLSLLQVIEDHEQIRPSDIAELRQFHPSLVTRKVREVEEAGYVEVIADPADGRSYLVSLTPAGSQELRRLLEFGPQAICAVREKLGTRRGANPHRTPPEAPDVDGCGVRSGATPADSPPMGAPARPIRPAELTPFGSRTVGSAQRGSTLAGRGSRSTLNTAALPVAHTNRPRGRRDRYRRQAAATAGRLPWLHSTDGGPRGGRSLRSR